MARPRRFTDEEIIQIRREYHLGQKYKREYLKRTTVELAKKYGITNSSMHDLVFYKTYTEVFEDLWEVPDIGGNDD